MRTSSKKKLTTNTKQQQNHSVIYKLLNINSFQALDELYISSSPENIGTCIYEELSKVTIPTTNSKSRRNINQSNNTTQSNILSNIDTLDNIFHHLVYSILLRYWNEINKTSIEENDEILEEPIRLIPFEEIENQIPEEKLSGATALLQTFAACYTHWHEQHITDIIGRPLSEGPFAIASVLLNRWPSLTNEDLKQKCIDIFKFISETYTELRPQFGRVYVLHLLVTLGSTQHKGGSTIISQLYKYRDILPLIDFEEVSADFLKTHLIRCFSNATILSMEIGRRFLGFVLSSVHPELTSQIIDWIRITLPNCRSGSSMVKALSDVLVNSWKLSESTIKLQLERNIHDLAEHVLLCNPKTAAKFRELLVNFCQKRDAPSSEIVYKIFAPILYRHLPVACWKVRFNATAFFSVAFPLVDAGLPAGEYEAEIERQYDTLIRLTNDTHPEVRRVAVQGICRVLLAYWEMIPFERIKSMLDVLLMHAAKDRSTPQVRVAAFEGLMLVLTNPMSHPALTALLPKVSHAIDDINPVVRKSLALLLSKANVPGFQLQSVVPVSGILQRLVHDQVVGQLERTAFQLRSINPNNKESETLQSAVALASLMFDSVFGFDELSKQVERVLMMAEKFPLSLLAFVDLTANQLENLVRTRLAAAIFHFAARKGQDVIGLIEEREKETLQDDSCKVLDTRIRKHTAITAVLLNSVALLLPSLNNNSESLCKETETSAVSTKTKKSTKGRSKKSIPISKKNATDEPLFQFLNANFNEELFSSLVSPLSPVKAQTVEVLCSLPDSFVAQYAQQWWRPLSTSILDLILLQNSDNYTLQDMLLFDSIMRICIKTDVVHNDIILPYWQNSFNEFMFALNHLTSTDKTVGPISEPPLKKQSRSKRRGTSRDQQHTIPIDNTFPWTSKKSEKLQKALKLLELVLSNNDICKSILLPNGFVSLKDHTTYLKKIFHFLCLPPEELLTLFQYILVDSADFPSLLNFLTDLIDAGNLLTQAFLQHTITVRIEQHHDHTEQEEAENLFSDLIENLSRSLNGWKCSFASSNLDENETNHNLSKIILNTVLSLTQYLIDSIALAVAFEVVPASCSDLADFIEHFMTAVKIGGLAEDKQRACFKSVGRLITLLADSGHFSLMHIMELVESALFTVPIVIENAFEINTVLIKPSLFLKRSIRANSPMFSNITEALQQKLNKHCEDHPDDFKKHRLISQFITSLVDEDTTTPKDTIMNNENKIIDKSSDTEIVVSNS